jgi:hypothetical protein
VLYIGGIVTAEKLSHRVQLYAINRDSIPLYLAYG